jgi:hypothetical protein
MDSPVLQTAVRLLLGIASLWCFVTAFSWYRATKEMQRTGDAYRLPLQFPAYLTWLDLFFSAARRNRQLPPDQDHRLERAEFMAIIFGNLARVVALFTCAFGAGLLAIAYWR